MPVAMRARTPLVWQSAAAPVWPAGTAVGDVVLQDAESGITREFTIDEKLRDDFARAAQAHRDEVARTLRRCDAPLLTLRTDRDWIADVVRFVANRRRGAMAGGR